MTNNLVESLIGAAVLLVAGWFLIFAYERTDSADRDGYILEAKFNRADGLSIGSDVRVSGIKVGSVTSQHLDTDTFQAVIKFSVRDEVKLPEDTAAAVTAEGLLGGVYLSLIPGGMLEVLEDGDEISETQDSIDLLGLIGKFAFNDDSNKDAE